MSHEVSQFNSEQNSIALNNASITGGGKMRIGLHFGALTESVSKQLSEQFNTPIDLPEFDKDAEALVRIYIRGIISDSENTKARKRLIKKITAYLNAHPPTVGGGVQDEYKIPKAKKKAQNTAQAEKEG